MMGIGIGKNQCERLVICGGGIASEAVDEGFGLDRECGV